MPTKFTSLVIANRSGEGAIYFHHGSVDVVGNPVGFQLVVSFGKGQDLCCLMVHKANFQFLHNQIVLESVNSSKPTESARTYSHRRDTCGSCWSTVSGIQRSTRLPDLTLYSSGTCRHPLWHWTWMAYSRCSAWKEWLEPNQIGDQTQYSWPMLLPCVPWPSWSAFWIVWLWAIDTYSSGWRISDGNIQSRQRTYPKTCILRWWIQTWRIS